jgi:hypothetical protein
MDEPFEEIATFAQILKTALRRGKNWEALSSDAKEALEQTATSISRILNGDPLESRHWKRAAGYLNLRVAILDTKLEADIAHTVGQRIRPAPPVTFATRPTLMPRAPEEPAGEGV